MFQETFSKTPRKPLKYAECPNHFSFHFTLLAGKTRNGSGNAFNRCSHLFQLQNLAPTHMPYPLNTARHGRPDAGCASYVNVSDILMSMCVGWGWGPGSVESGSQRVGKHAAETMWASWFMHRGWLKSNHSPRGATKGGIITPSKKHMHP